MLTVCHRRSKSVATVGQLPTDADDVGVALERPRHGQQFERGRLVNTVDSNGITAILTSGADSARRYDNAVPLPCRPRRQIVDGARSAGPPARASRELPIPTALGETFHLPGSTR
jgi:hypothetical protein